MARTLVVAVQPVPSGCASRLTSKRTIQAVVPTFLIKARLVDALANATSPGKVGSGGVAAIGVAVEEPLETAARHDDPPAEPQGRKLSSSDEVIRVCPRDTEGSGSLGHCEDESFVTVHEVTSQERGPGGAITEDWRVKWPNATSGASMD